GGCQDCAPERLLRAGWLSSIFPDGRHPDALQPRIRGSRHYSNLCSPSQRPRTSRARGRLVLARNARRADRCGVASAEAEMEPVRASACELRDGLAEARLSRLLAAPPSLAALPAVDAAAPTHADTLR